MINARSCVCLVIMIPFLALGQNFQPNLIRGLPVEEGTFEDVVGIRLSGAACSATIIGKRVILTAAHCGSTGSIATFKALGIEYNAKLTQSLLYRNRDHDLALGLANKEIAGVDPSTIGGEAADGEDLVLLGYGCIRIGGGGGNDGILRIGLSKITGFSGFYDIVSSDENGAALCFGDSGGPAFTVENGMRLLLGVNSKGNIRDTNYNTRLDHPDSVQFLQKFASDNGVEICGLNADCKKIEHKP